jgi:hypothetical protein
MSALQESGIESPEKAASYRDDGSFDLRMPLRIKFPLMIKNIGVPSTKAHSYFPNRPDFI